jgi:hypothetical protein
MIPQTLKRGTAKGRRGFVLPLVIFGLVIMSAVAVAALLAAGDENLSSRAMRESSTAFYAAEAGLHETYAKWDLIDTLVVQLDPGETLELPWRELNSGSKYRARVWRIDNGVQPLFTLTVEGRGPGYQGGMRTLSFTLTSGPAAPGSGYSIGKCCRAAVTMRGSAAVEEDAGVSGFDENPDGWGDACPEATDDKPGIIIKDTGNLEFDEGGFSVGAPDIVEDPTISDVDFDEFGTALTWEDIKDMADHVIGVSDDDTNIYGGVGPSYNGDGSCNTDDPYNWGSPDPSDPCFDYFPIIVISGKVRTYDLYAQGIFILDWDESLPWGEKGSEFDLEEGVVFNGIVLGKGCVEVEGSAEFHGGMLVDGYYRNEESCAGDMDFAMNDGAARIDWSRCAVDRAIINAGLDDYAEVENPGGYGTPEFIKGRAFGESLH